MADVAGAAGRPHARDATLPVLIVYVVRGPNVVIIAVAHHRRRPGYWMDRAR